MTREEFEQLAAKHQTPTGNPVLDHLIKMYNDFNRSRQQTSEQQLPTVGADGEVGEQEHQGTIHDSAEPEPRTGD